MPTQRLFARDAVLLMLVRYGAGWEVNCGPVESLKSCRVAVCAAHFTVKASLLSYLHAEGMQYGRRVEQAQPDFAFLS